MATTWVVAYDFSDLSRAALATAADMLSKQGGGRVMVVHVHQLRTGVDGNGIDLALLVASDVEESYIKDAKRRLAEDLAAIHAPGVTLDGHVMPGRPAAVICSVADDTKARMVVIGSHGRHGFERVLLGSVAEAVLRHAPCAVLVVKEPLASASARTDPPANG